MKRLPRLIFLTALPLFAALAGTACTKQEPALTTRFQAFGTQIDLTVIGTDPASFEDISSLIEADFAQLHQTWVAWKPGPLGRVNELLPTGKRIAVPPSVLPLIQRGIDFAEKTDNLFNPAIGKLIELWGFHRTHPEQASPPSAAEISRLIAANPRMSDLELDGIFLRCRNPEVKLDFGGFGKGYGVDLAIAHLRQLGVHNAIVNAGGDLRAIGTRAGLPWRVTIPRSTGAGVFATVDVRGDESVFTAGSYERHYMRGGKRYHPVIDPRTGYPAEAAAAVTVLYPEAMTADAAATALLIAGPKEWHRIARSLGLRYVLLTEENGTVHMSPEMAARIQFVEQPGSIVTSPPLSVEAHRPTDATRSTEG